MSHQTEKKTEQFLFLILIANAQLDVNKYYFNIIIIYVQLCDI